MTDRLQGRESIRLPAIDLVRGIVMVLMTLDHSSAAFNAGRLMADGAATFHPDAVFEPLQFVIRWVTHLCAPTFVMLSGASLALSVTRRQQDGVPSSQIDRDILIRGALLIAIDAVWMGWMWRLGLPLQLGVLYAIGVSMIGLIVLRRLPAALVAGLGLAIMAGGEAVTGLLDPTTTLAAATLAGGQVGSIYYLYPFLPWTGFMLVGWAIGMRIAGPGMRARDWLTLAAVAAATFVIVRGGNGYGNAHVLRRDGSWNAAWNEAWNEAWIEWLHVSKYPPSLAYAALELGIAFALLAAVWRWARPWKPLVVLGQTALFYYVIHAHLLKGTAAALGVYRHFGVGATLLAWAVTLVALYPACRWYLGVKRRHPRSVLRFL
ncbi:MAG TPA: heparan-alpha-glucosaminide N-acetyltransferase domain-containing protein [Kofleriaceae bacterium]|jgi:uncharacterized membrane protein